MPPLRFDNFDQRSESIVEPVDRVVWRTRPSGSRKTVDIDKHHRDRTCIAVGMRILLPETPNYLRRHVLAKQVCHAVARAGRCYAGPELAAQLHPDGQHDARHQEAIIGSLAAALSAGKY